MNNFRHDGYLFIANVEDLEERLKSAIFATVAKPAFVHVKRDRLRWFLVFGSKSEFGLRVNKLANQPRGGHSIHSRSRPCDPYAVPIFGRGDSALCGG